ncbi:hypothetical protein MASR2M52_09390 [Pedobacter sp.]
MITPSYNQGAYLEETILAVLQQGYPNLEYIIIDGASIDNTLDIIKKYENKLSFWISEKDEGQYDAINKGFAKATGELYTYINSDDLLLKGSLFTAAQLFIDYPQIEWLSGIPNAIDEQSRLIEVGEIPQWNKYRYYSKDYKYIQQEGIFFRKSLWEKTGKYMNTRYPLAADLELWSRFFEYAELYVLPTLLGSFRKRLHHQKSLEQIELYNKEAEIIIDKLTISKRDKKLINQSKNIIYRFIKHFPKHSLLWKYLDIYGLKHNYFKFPSNIIFDRNSQKYIIENKW